MHLRTALLPFLVTLTACAQRATGVVVSMDTNAPSDRALFIRATVHDGARDGGAGVTRAWVRGGTMSTLVLPASFGIVPASRDALDAPVTVRFDLTLDVGPAGEPALTFRRTARFRFVPNEQRELPVLFDVACGTTSTGCTTVPAAQCSRSVRCDEQGLTCGEGGTCVPIEAMLQARDAGVPDGSSVTLCPRGMTACNARCVDLSSDRLHCGGCGMECPSSVPNGAPACVDGACRATCNAGSEPVGNTCDVKLPRPIAPLSTTVLGSQRVQLTWEAPMGLTGVRAEFCRERACDAVAESVEVTEGTTALSPLLAPGVWYWRLRGRVGSTNGSRTSAVWQFTVRRAVAPIDPRAASPAVFDADRDGLADLAVPAFAANTNRGTVSIYHWRGTTLETTPRARLTGPAENSYFGQSIAVADVNGDGYADLLVGAPVAYNTGGALFVYHGGPTGLSMAPAMEIRGPSGTQGFFAGSVSNAGDVNGDGFGDAIVGQFNGYSMTDAGTAFVYLGSPAGLSTTPSARLNSPDGAQSGFGRTVAGTGDLNRDGYADVLVGAVHNGTNVGRAHVYLGSVRGIEHPASSTVNSPGSATQAFGVVVPGADFNADGFDDAVIGSSRILPDEGHVSVFPGSATGPAARPLFVIDKPAAAAGFFGLGGRPVDLNGDGRPDLLTRTVNPFSTEDPGRVDLFVTAMGVAQNPPTRTLASRDGPGSHFGTALTSPGDVNGDGYDDVVISAPGVNRGGGRVYLYLGGATVLPTAPIAIESPDGPGSAFGSALPP